MKAFALALVLANLAFFAWWRWLRPVEAPSPSPPAVQVPTLTLASEADNAGARTAPAAASDANAPEESPAPEAAQTPTATASQTPQKLPASRCISLGPFHDLPAATRAAAALRERGYAPRTRAEEGDVWAGLWVYLENISTKAEAQRVMSVLKQNGITDAYLMPTAEKNLDISLGIFSEPARAQRRAADVRTLGFTPTIADRTRKGTLYWLNIDLKPADMTPNPADLNADTGRIVRLEILACPGTASSGPG